MKAEGAPPRAETVHTRVAIVAPSLDILGGQGIQARALVERLHEDGVDVMFLPVNPAFPALLQWVRRIPYLRTLLNQTFYLPALRHLRRVDVAHLFSASYWSFLLAPAPAMLAARALGKRVVLNYHSGEAADHLDRWGLLIHPWLRLAHEIVVPSEYLQSVFALQGYRSCVVPNFIDVDAFRYRDRVPLRPRLLSTRNLEPYYRVDVTLAAFARVKARLPDATLDVAGYGSEEAGLRRLAASLGVEGIRFLGRIEPEAMASVYDAADVFVNASEVDNQPLSVLEAFAAGLPVVSTATGDIVNLVRPQETGLLVPPGNPAAMADAIVELFEHPDRALRYARRARQDVERFSWNGVKHLWRAVHSGEESPSAREVDGRKHLTSTGP